VAIPVVLARRVIGYNPTTVTDVAVPDLGVAPGFGAIVLPYSLYVKCSSAGAVLAATPPVGAGQPVISVTRNAAGDYTVLLTALTGGGAAEIAPFVSSNTNDLIATATVTDATHIAVRGSTNAGVATDCAFSLEIKFLLDA